MHHSMFSHTHDDGHSWLCYCQFIANTNHPQGRQSLLTAIGCIQQTTETLKTQPLDDKAAIQVVLKGHKGTMEDAPRDLCQGLCEDGDDFIGRFENGELEPEDREDRSESPIEGEPDGMTRARYVRVLTVIKDAARVCNAMLRGLQKEDDNMGRDLVESWESATFHIKAMAEVGALGVCGM